MRIIRRILALLITLLMLIPFSLFASVLSVSALDAEPTCQLQYDSKWNYVDYGTDTVYNTACAIFAFSNAVNYLTGNKPDIVTVADWAYSAGHYTSTNGTNHSFYSSVQAKYGTTYGFTLRQVDSYWSNSEIKNHLANGGTAVFNVQNHYIALVGYNTSTGQYHIYDSANSSNRGTQVDGTVWLTENQISQYPMLAPMYDNGCWLFTRTGSAPAWYPDGVQNLGDTFYARLKNVNGSEVYMSMNDDNKTITGKQLNIGSSNQIWKFTRQSDGSYEIENLASFLRLDVSSWGTENSTPIHLYTDTDGANQRWKIYTQGDGYRLVPQHTTGMAFDCSAGAKNAQIYQQSGGDAQKFYIEKVSASKLPSVDLGTEFYATISNTAGGNTVYFTNMEETADVAVKGQAKTQATNQIWRFYRQSGDGSYEISSAVNGQNMTVEATTDGTKITLTADDNSTKQRWFIYKQSSGYRLESQFASSSALDCSASAKNAQIWTNAWGGENQTFYIDYISYDKVDSNFAATVQNQNNSKYLTANADGKINTQNANSASTQTWLFEKQSDGTFKIKNASSGGYLDITDSAIRNQTEVKHASAANDDRQKWYVYKYASNYYRIIPKIARNSALDVDSNTDKIQIYQQSGGPAQSYIITEVEYHEHENKYTYVSNNNGTHIKKYSCCGEVITASEACSGGTATCTSKKVCQYCKAAYGNQGSHNYSVIKTDDTYHWKKCKNCTAVSDKTEHTFDNACDATCNGNCGYTRDAGHIGGTATCINKARCEVCNNEYGEAFGHDFVVGNVYSKDESGHAKKCQYCNTYDTVAEHEYGDDNMCDACGYDKTVPHTHAYTKLTVSDEYKVSDANCQNRAIYYKSCECGAHGEETFETGEKDKNNHVSTSFVYVPNDDILTHSKRYECCGMVVEAEENHSFGENDKCTACGMEEGHTHSYSTEYSINEDNHWYECACGAENSKAEHSYGEDNKCTACGAEKPAEEIIGNETEAPGGTESDVDNTVEESEKDDDEGDKGCDSYVSGATAVLAIVASLGTGICFKKKRRE